MAAPDVYEFQRTTSGDTVTIVGVSFALAPSDVDPLHHYRIFADTLTLSGRFELPGRNVTIRARIVDAKDATLSVDGAAPDKKPEPKYAKPAAGAGQPGPGGDNGDDAGPNGGGKKAGNIDVVASELRGKLTLSAGGGNGRDGGDGGNAGAGGGGGNGPDDEIIRRGHRQEFERIQPGRQGQDGFPGGRGGNAGKPGGGGAGGAIRVATLVQPPAGVLTQTAPAGASGTPGRPGNGAGGGTPGIGGRKAHEVTRRGPHRSEIKDWEIGNERYPSGAQGPRGDDGSKADPIPGTAGTTAFNLVTDANALYTDDADVYAQLQLSMRQMAVAYLGADYATARTLLLWLLVQLPSDKAKKKDGSAYDSRWTGLRARVRVYLSRLERSLDYFGNPSNWTPIVAFDRYRTDVTTLIDAGAILEGVYVRYDAAVKTKQAAAAAFDDALKSAADTIVTYEGQRTKLLAAREATWAEVLDLGTKLDAQRAIVDAAQAKFKAAVEQKAACDSFKQIISLVVSIATFGAGALGAVKAISSLAGSAAETAASAAAGKDGQPSILDVFKKVYEAGKTGKDIYDKYKAIQPFNDSINPDYGKIAMEQKEFDDQLKPYLDMPDAQEYKRVVHDFVAIVQARNAKLSLFAQLHEEVVQTEGLIAQTRALADKLKAERAAGADPTLSPYRSFVKGLYDDYRQLVLRHLYNENMAFRYWSLTDRPFLTGDNTFGELALAHAKLVSDTLDAIQASQSPTQRFEPQMYTLTDSGPDRAAQFKAFRDKGTLTFSIPVTDEHYEGWAQVLADTFTISVTGAVTSAADNRLTVYLYHLGKGVLLTPKGATVQYTHDRVMSVYTYTVVGGADKRQGGGTLGDPEGSGKAGSRISISPFASWTIDVTKFNPGLDLSKVTKISIAFSGTYHPRVDTLGVRMLKRRLELAAEAS